MLKLIFGFSIFEWSYIIAISLQLAGALLLIKRFWGNTEQRVLSYYKNNKSVMVNKGKITLRKEDLQDCAYDIFMNRIAFICIFGGYIIGVFGAITKWKVFVIIWIIAITIILLWIAPKISSCLAKKKYPQDVEKEYCKEMDINISFIEF